MFFAILVRAKTGNSDCKNLLGSRHSFWETLGDTGSDLGDAVFLMFSISSAKFVYVYFVAVRSPTSSNFSVLLNIFAQDFNRMVCSFGWQTLINTLGPCKPL